MGAKLCNILHQQQNTEAEDTKQCFDYSELLAMKHQLVSTIQKETRVAAGAEKLYRATKNRKTKAQVKELRKSSEEKVKALYSSLLKLTQEIARKEAENTRVSDAVLETTETTNDIDVVFPAEKVTGPEVPVISDTASDSSQHHPDDSAEEPGPETEQPQVPPDSEVPAEENEDAEEEKCDLPAEDEDEEEANVEQQQPEKEEDSDVQVHEGDSSGTSQGPHPGDYSPTQRDCQAEEPLEETQSTQ
uniref:REM-1 domain-containing protein n=1 Tax=Xenopus tropicalis TaxID=8364 RepID=A0A1B8Y0V1_XENTR